MAFVLNISKDITKKKKKKENKRKRISKVEVGCPEE